MKQLRTLIFLSAFLNVTGPLCGMVQEPSAWQPPLFDEWQERLSLFDKKTFDVYGHEDAIQQTIQDVLQALDEYLKRHAAEDASIEKVKKIVPPSGARIPAVSDLHGSVHSLMEVLKHRRTLGMLANDWKMPKNAFFASLGDNTDRGAYGLEALATLLFLELKNPGCAILVRGNHEYKSVNNAFLTGELLKKIIASGNVHPMAAHQEMMAKILKFYSTLPSALFIGNRNDNGVFNYALLAHAGIELDYTPGDFLTNGKEHDSHPVVLEKTSGAYDANAAGLQVTAAIEATDGPSPSGFNSTDFFERIPGHEDEDLWFKPERGWQATHELLKFQLEHLSTEEAHVQVLIRGHQHSEPPLEEMLKRGHGVACEANGRLYTICNARVPYNLQSDSYVEITTADKYEDWTMTHWVNLPRIGWHQNTFLISKGPRASVRRPFVDMPSRPSIPERLDARTTPVCPSGRTLEVIEPLSPALVAAVERLMNEDVTELKVIERSNSDGAGPA